MRKIKFRGREQDGFWTYGDLRHEGNITGIIENGIYSWVDSSTVGQYTGLKDADGREIYEGDIIEMNRGCYERDGIHTDFIFHAVVCWVKNGFMYKGPGIFGSTFDNVKVIGNVHDNPELLEVES